MSPKKAQEPRDQATGGSVAKTRARKTVSSPRKGAKTPKQFEESPSDPQSIFGDIDLHLFGEGRHERICEKLGAHLTTRAGRRGVAFAVWAPNANRVSAVGYFNGWDGKRHPMRSLSTSGSWECFVPDLKPGELYKYEIQSGGHTFLKADPYAAMMEAPPDTSSVVFESNYKFRDRAWMAKRVKRQAWRETISIYEIHLGS